MYCEPIEPETEILRKRFLGDSLSHSSRLSDSAGSSRGCSRAFESCGWISGAPDKAKRRPLETNRRFLAFELVYSLLVQLRQSQRENQV